MSRPFACQEIIYKLPRHHVIVIDTYQYVLAMHANQTQQQHDRGSQQNPSIPDRIAHRKYTGSHVAFKQVHQRLEIPGGKQAGLVVEINENEPETCWITN